MYICLEKEIWHRSVVMCSAIPAFGWRSDGHESHTEVSASSPCGGTESSLVLSMSTQITRNIAHHDSYVIILHLINFPQSSLLSRSRSLLSFRGNAFQNRSVSSPAPVTMVSPSGLMARYSTRFVCPVSDATMFNVGYFHIHIWFWAVVDEKP
jgi:hypothetical protein